MSLGRHGAATKPLKSCEMALVDGLSHLLVQVTDLDRSEAFYRDVFGFGRGAHIQGENSK